MYAENPHSMFALGKFAMYLETKHCESVIEQMRRNINRYQLEGMKRTYTRKSIAEFMGLTATMFLDFVHELEFWHTDEWDFDLLSERAIRILLGKVGGSDYQIDATHVAKSILEDARSKNEKCSD